MTPTMARQIAQSCVEGYGLEAIRILRSEIPGMGLATAKDYITAQGNKPYDAIYKRLMQDFVQDETQELMEIIRDIDLLKSRVTQLLKDIITRREND